MNNQFRIYQDRGNQMIERLSYPRFTGVLTFNSPISDIEDIQIDEDVLDAGDIAQALREAGEFILNYKPKADD